MPQPGDWLVSRGVTSFCARGGRCLWPDPISHGHQQPHDISPTIISQLHNYFLHRLVNDLDIRAIEKAVSYLDRVSFESMPILPTGVCILSGVAAQIPVMVTVSPLEPQFAPNSRTMSIVAAWSRPLVPPDEDEEPDENEDDATEDDSWPF